MGFEHNLEHYIRSYKKFREALPETREELHCAYDCAAALSNLIPIARKQHQEIESLEAENANLKRMLEKAVDCISGAFEKHNGCAACPCIISVSGCPECDDEDHEAKCYKLIMDELENG
jgi:hypothetical protein